MLAQTDAVRLKLEAGFFFFSFFFFFWFTIFPRSVLLLPTSIVWCFALGVSHSVSAAVVVTATPIIVFILSHTPQQSGVHTENTLRILIILIFFQLWSFCLWNLLWIFSSTFQAIYELSKTFIIVLVPLKALTIFSSCLMIQIQRNNFFRWS
ncbi:hypothetical protein EDC94DRAFT_258150 [Helicostylum pulchrum]|nr:hypothetical protein EDC94DRAFT_258150 [Helicostylum pulchrum]